MSFSIWFEHLSTIKNDEIKKQITKAISAHGMWKVRLKDAINKQSSEFEVNHVRTPHHCELGKWLNSEKASLLKFPDYSKVFDLHAKVHEEPARIMQLALAGKKDEASHALGLGSSFANLSAHLTQAMMHWKQAL